MYITSTTPTFVCCSECQASWTKVISAPTFKSILTATPNCKWLVVRRETPNLNAKIIVDIHNSDMTLRPAESWIVVSREIRLVVHPTRNTIVALFQGLEARMNRLHVNTSCIDAYLPVLQVSMTSKTHPASTCGANTCAML